MANYPPPGQAYPPGHGNPSGQGSSPDQPSDPWQEAPLWGAGPEGAATPYGEPSAFIGEQYSPPTGYPATGPAPVWGPPQPPQSPQRGGLSTVMIGVITAIAVILGGGAILGVYAVSRNGTPSAHASNSHSAGPSATATAPATSASPSPTEADFRTARAGDCVQNRGTGDAPDLHVVTCAPGTYQILKRIDGTEDEKRCDGLPSLTASYHYSLGDTKFVYCLKKLG